MWTETTREQYRRDGLRYASDMTDAEWAMVEPFMPAVKRLGRPRKVDLRGVVEGLLYILRTACPWRLLPHDFPNRSTVQRSFYAWQTDGLWERINLVLLQQARERADRAGTTPARRSTGASAVCHEHIARVRRCGAMQEMRVGPSRPAVRCRPQTAASCSRQERLW